MTIVIKEIRSLGLNVWICEINGKEEIRAHSKNAIKSRLLVLVNKG